MAYVIEFEHLKISLEAINLATNNFSEDNCIGRGGFGQVYKGEIDLFQGKSVVAFKRLNRKFGQGDTEFWKEIRTLSQYKHENIVSLVGYCDEGVEKLLIYEYAHKNSLEKYLNKSEVTWVRRLEICIGAARGLAYLHTPTNDIVRILHRDVKSANILLDENWNAKIADFGLSKVAPANGHFTYLITDAVGTLGYIDPEYMESRLLTKESDVYSFGVVLFEVLCGRLCYGNDINGDPPLIGLVREYHKENKIPELIFDPMKGKVNSDSVKVFTEIAYQCLERERTKRPSMKEIVGALERALQANAPGRQCISSFTPPVREKDLLEAEAMQNLVLVNTAHDIVYRNFDRESDITHHVFRWDTTPYEQVFANGFHARRQENVSDKVYYNLYVNRGGRPLDNTRPAPQCFVSTTLDSGWCPSVSTEQGVLIVTRYEIYAPGGIWVAQTLGDCYRYRAHDEVAFVNGIAPQYIRSAQLFRLQVSGRHTRRERVNNIIHINGGFNPQLFYADERMPEIRRPIKLYENPTTKKKEKLVVQIWNPSPHMMSRTKREINIGYVNYKASSVDDRILINAAFRSSRKDEAYVFINNEYACINYAPGRPNDRVVNGPHLICDSFLSLSGTPFGEYGIDCAFTTHYGNVCFIFAGSLCAKIDYAPGTKNDKILKGPMTISKMFVFLKGTVFETGVDAAFESSIEDEAYLFKGNKYALINYSDNKPELFHIRDIGEGYPSLKGTIFDKGIDFCFASHRWNEAYIFRGDTYARINFDPRSNKDYIIAGPKNIFPSWRSLDSILPRPNDGLDVHDHEEAPDRD